MPGLLDAIRRTRKPFRFDPDGDPGPPVVLEGQRVLLIYLFPNLGDVILLAPVVKSLLDAGAKKVGVVVKAAGARIFKLVDLPVKTHVLPEMLQLPAEAAGYGHLWQTPQMIEASAEFAETIAERYDIAVDLTARNDAESRRWVAAAKAPHRFGWIMDGERPEDAGLTWGTLDQRYQADRHWSRYQVLPLRCLGLSEPDFNLPWKVRPTAENKALSLYGKSNGPRVLIVPGSKAERKRWPPERFAEIGGRLARDLNAQIVVTGAPDEKPLVRSIAVGIGGIAQAFTG
ncbi:MAG: glycosyltransferase family 9 protein, partial [Myxococcota bacterium]